MSCDLVQRRLSDAFTDTGAVSVATSDDDHVATCPDCARFAAALPELRGRFRLGEVELPPPIADRVMAELRSSAATEPAFRRRLPASVGRVPELGRIAAVFLVAVAVGSALVGVRRPLPAAAVDLRELVLAGQHGVTGLDAEVEVTEHGWHPDLGPRTYLGRLRYRAPETLLLELSDTTAYGSRVWPANDVTVAVGGDRSWTSSLGACPPAGMPECLPPAPRVRVLDGREPFDAGDPVPLDLVVPVGSFGTTAHPAELGRRTIDGRDAVGTRVTAAQVDGLLDVLTGTGALRAVHPTDPVEVWLDASLGVPVSVTVVAGDGFERDRWAAVRGFGRDAPGATLLTWRIRDLAPDARGPVDVRPPAADRSATGPFVDGPVDLAGIGPTWLPTGMAPHRQGRSGDVVVASWSDGRAWLTLRATRDHTDERLFGAHGTFVRRVELPGGGVGHVAEGGQRVLLHGATADVELRGSVAPEILLRVAGGLELEGLAVPRSWPDAASASVDDASSAVPGLLLPGGAAGELPGFDGPGLRVSDGVVSATWSGPGARGFVLTQRRGASLGPPLDDLVVGVRVRGHDGRFTPASGDLQWDEAGSVVSLRSTTLGLEELLAIADVLEVAR